MPTTDENNEWEAMVTQALLDARVADLHATAESVPFTRRVYWYLWETGRE
jgi:hypothetical protein